MNSEVTRFDYFSPLFVNQTLFTWGASVGEQSFYLRVGILGPKALKPCHCQPAWQKSSQQNENVAHWAPPVPVVPGFWLVLELPFYYPIIILA